MKIFQNIIGAALSLTAVFALTSCANETSNSNSTRPANIAPTNVNAASSANVNSNTNSNPANSNVNVDTTNANNKTVSVGDIKRISFVKGATSRTTAVTLLPGSKQQFAIEATYGQKIKITADSKEAIVKMISGTDRLVESAGGNLVVSVNVSGDVIFEVRNASNKNLKTTIRAEVNSAY